MQTDYDLIIIGGGFYGCELAIEYKKKYDRILIIEREEKLLQRASYVNQARVHNGYHYPRDFVTAYRSHINFPRFVTDYKQAIDSSFTKLYAIAANNSKVSPKQFFRFCQSVGSRIKPAASKYEKLFDPTRIDQVFEVQEYAFNAEVLKQMCEEKLEKAGIEVAYGVEALRVQPTNGALSVDLSDGRTLTAQEVLNATYSRINSFLRASKLPTLPFKHEVIEMTLVDVPPELKNVGITVMDGPFFSVMPFPARGLHSLSHVHFTPIVSWTDDSDEDDRDPYEYMKNHINKSRHIFMVKDAARYLPVLRNAEYKDSLYEVKTVLLGNEDNDGRPILYRRSYSIPNFSIVMGGKIDNIYDIIDAMQKGEQTT